MIPREQFDAYNRAVANLTSGSSHEVEAAMLAWHDRNPEASVAEGRDAAIEIMSGFMQDFDDAAASLAAKWYDLQSEKAHYKLPSAVTVTSYSRESVEEVARYQAGKLVDGDWPGFARMCGEAAANDARLSLNKTILANAKRDRKRGVRFARVTTGAETCPFCYMLSSRGAVYYSRKTAGALDRWHNSCDCKVVMGFEDDPDAEIVQHYDPKGMRGRMSEMEDQTGLSFSKQDDSRALRGFMELHDPDWLMCGRRPDEPSYVSEQVKARATEAEKHTASMLGKFGIKATFIQDYVWVKVGGLKRKVGLPDLENGIEIKTLGSSRNPYGAIDNYLSNAEKKKDLSCVVIDNSISEHIGDTELVKAAKAVVGDYESIPSLYVILKSGALKRIK